MAIAEDRAHLGANHAMRGIMHFLDGHGLDRFGEAWPAASRKITDESRSKQANAPAFGAKLLRADRDAAWMKNRASAHRYWRDA
jgi:hypothetical protein